MLWIDLPKLFRGGDADVLMTDGSGIHFRGPLITADPLRFDPARFVLAITWAWTKVKVDPGQWVDYRPMELELNTTLTRIREPGGDRVRISIIVEGPIVPPSKTPTLRNIGELTLHPADEETMRWHKSVGQPTLAEVVSAQ